MRIVPPGTNETEIVHSKPAARSSDWPFLWLWSTNPTSFFSMDPRGKPAGLVREPPNPSSRRAVDAFLRTVAGRGTAGAEVKTSAARWFYQRATHRSLVGCRFSPGLDSCTFSLSPSSDLRPVFPSALEQPPHHFGPRLFQELLDFGNGLQLKAFRSRDERSFH